MKKIRLIAFVISVFIFHLSPLKAQTTISQIDRIMNAPMPKAGQYMDSVMNNNAKLWLSENGLDSLDQKKIPKVVTMGVLMNANMSHFLISSRHEGNNSFHSTYMRAGAEIGGFMDFLVARHFAIQARLVFDAEQNQFGLIDSTNHLWSFGADIPVLFLYRLGNLQKGYFNIGAGIYAHFTFASNLGIYRNNESGITPSETPPFYVSLHDNHAGVIAHVGYEFPIGIQINMNYLLSLSDMFGYYKTTKGTIEGDYGFYPQRLSLGIAYRWKRMQEIRRPAIRIPVDQ